MHKKTILALGGATLALAVASPAALGAGTQVTVRVEGKTRTLLQTKSVHTHGGFITRGGAPSGACPATSGIGALDVATKHRWGGNYDSSFGLAVTSILGEAHTFSSNYFWEIFIDNKPASVGACGLSLKRGDSLVFAAVPTKGREDLTAIRAPRSVAAGKPFRVKVVRYTPGGVAKPLAGAPVRLGKKSVLTNAHGVATVTITGTGTVTLHSAPKGEVRPAPVTVRVTG
jgi:hypothetical protein